MADTAGSGAEAPRQAADLLGLLSQMSGGDLEAARAEADALADGWTREEVERRARGAADLAQAPGPLPAGTRAATAARAWALARIADEMDEAGQLTYHAPGHAGRQDGDVGTAPGEPARAWSAHVISNFDYRLDDGLEEDLRAGKLVEHTAYDFHGVISYDSSSAEFTEEVSAHRVVQGTRRAATLPELVMSVNDEFGWG